MLPTKIYGATYPHQSYIYIAEPKEHYGLHIMTLANTGHAETAAEIVRRWNAFEELQALVAEVNGDLCDAVADLQGWASCGPEGFTSDEQARMDEYQETIDETAKKLAAYLQSDSQEGMRVHNIDTKA